MAVWFSWVRTASEEGKENESCWHQCGEKREEHPREGLSPREGAGMVTGADQRPGGHKGDGTDVRYCGEKES